MRNLRRDIIENVRLILNKKLDRVSIASWALEIITKNKSSGHLRIHEFLTDFVLGELALLNEESAVNEEDLLNYIDYLEGRKVFSFSYLIKLNLSDESVGKTEHIKTLEKLIQDYLEGKEIDRKVIISLKGSLNLDEVIDILANEAIINLERLLCGFHSYLIGPGGGVSKLEKWRQTQRDTQNLKLISESIKGNLPFNLSVSSEGEKRWCIVTICEEKSRRLPDKKNM